MSNQPKTPSSKPLCLDHYNEPERAPLCVPAKPALQDYDAFVAANKAGQKSPSLFDQARAVAKSFFGSLGGEPSEGPSHAPSTPKQPRAGLETYQPKR